MTRSDGETPDWDALRDEELARLVEEIRSRGVTDPLPTDVEFVRYVDPDEWGRVHAQCFQEQGFDVRERFDGGLDVGRVPQKLPEQRQALAAAEYRCWVMYPIHPRYSQPLSPAQIRVIYDYYLGTLIPCLRARGYDVGNPPDWETFLARYGTAEQWTPYSFVPDPCSDEEWQALNEDCPQYPATSAIYGDLTEK